MAKATSLKKLGSVSSCETFHRCTVVGLRPQSSAKLIFTLTDSERFNTNMQAVIDSDINTKM